MLSYEQALLAVEREIAALPSTGSGDAWIVLAEHTIERSFGWVIFYGSRCYAETGDLAYLVAGNAPYIINRHDGKISLTGTAYPIEHYIEDTNCALHIKPDNVASMQRSGIEDHR